MTHLVSMGAEAFASFAEEAVSSYAEDNVIAGRWPGEGAMERSRTEFDRLLPEGLQTPDHHLYEIVETAEAATVGCLWYSVSGDKEARAGFVYNIHIKPEYRGRGYAAAALVLLEEKARAEGLISIGLHVFGFNTAAQALYRSAGYGVTGLNMLKLLHRDEA